MQSFSSTQTIRLRFFLKLKQMDVKNLKGKPHFQASDVVSWSDQKQTAFQMNYTGSRKWGNGRMTSPRLFTFLLNLYKLTIGKYFLFLLSLNKKLYICSATVPELWMDIKGHLPFKEHHGSQLSRLCAEILGLCGGMSHSCCVLFWVCDSICGGAPWIIQQKADFLLPPSFAPVFPDSNLTTNSCFQWQPTSNQDFPNHLKWASAYLQTNPAMPKWPWAVKGFLSAWIVTL